MVPLSFCVRGPFKKLLLVYIWGRPFKYVVGFLANMIMEIEDAVGICFGKSYNIDQYN